MRIIIKNLILLIFVLSIIGCNSNSSEDINNDTKVLVIDSNISTGTTIGKVDIPQRANDEIEDI